MAKSLASELTPNIRVITIVPSLRDTPLAGRLLDSDAKKDENAEGHPWKRIGTANDSAEMDTFILSDKST